MADDGDRWEGFEHETGLVGDGRWFLSDHPGMLPPIEGRPVRVVVDDAETIGSNRVEMFDSVIARQRGIDVDREGRLWVTVVVWTFVTVGTILGGFALGILILFLIACVQVLLDFVLR